MILFTIAWFLAGIAGLHSGTAIDRAHKIRDPIPSDVWLVPMGGLLLLVTLFYAIQKATQKGESYD